ncbi:MAG: molybdopterin biosynthesis protein, partial [Candidatus Methanomethylicia archaeon]
MRKIFHKLVSIEEALKIVEGRVRLNPLGIEDMEITKSVGRILAEDIIADLDLPPFDRATMDGYAVRAEDTYNANEENPITLKVIGKVELGEEVRGEVKCGEAFEISTGAPIPIGANAVVMVEYTEREDDELKVYRPVRIGENIAQTGCDLML